MEKRFINEDFSYMLIIGGTGCYFFKNAFLHLVYVYVFKRLLNLIAVNNKIDIYHYKHRRPDKVENKTNKLACSLSMSISNLFLQYTR